MRVHPSSRDCGLLAPQVRIMTGIAHQNRIGNDCLLTSRRLPRSAAEALVDSGHVVRRYCVVADEGGSARIPEVWKIGYEFTASGRIWMDSHQDAERASLRDAGLPAADAI